MGLALHNLVLGAVVLKRDIIAIIDILISTYVYINIFDSTASLIS